MNNKLLSSKLLSRLDSDITGLEEENKYFRQLAKEWETKYDDLVHKNAQQFIEMSKIIVEKVIAGSEKSQTRKK